MHDKSRRTKEKNGQKKEEKKIKDEREKMQAENSSNEYRCKNQRLLLKEEETLEGKDALWGAVLLDKAKRGIKERIIKAYKEIFYRDAVMNTADSLCAGDWFFEEYYEDKT